LSTHVPVNTKSLLLAAVVDDADADEVDEDNKYNQVVMFS